MEGIILALAVGVIVGFVSAYFLPKSDKRELAIAKEQVARNEGRQEGRSEAQAEFHLKVEPFYGESKIGLPGFKKRNVQIGYEYRLFVKGIPCLEPSEHLCKEIKETELEPEALERLAASLAQSLVSGALSEVTTVLPVIHKTTKQ